MILASSGTANFDPGTGRTIDKIVVENAFNELWDRESVFVLFAQSNISNRN
jgi:hypothetical protein